MKHILENIFVYIFLITMITFSVVAVYLRFSNIDMTEARLFVTYWPFYIGGMIVIAGLFAIMLWKK